MRRLPVLHKCLVYTDRAFGLVGQMLHLPEITIETLHGFGGEQELPRPRALLNLFDGNLRVGDGPSGDGFIDDFKSDKPWWKFW